MYESYDSPYSFTYFFHLASTAQQFQGTTMVPVKALGGLQILIYMLQV